MNDAFGHPQSVVVIGGTSDIAREIVDVLIADRCRTLVLAGRDARGLEAEASRARSLGAETVETVTFDATDPDSAQSTVTRCFAAANHRVDLVVMAVGTLGEQHVDEVDAQRIAEVIAVNFSWPAAAIGVAAHALAEQGSGRVVVLSSVAGVRIRRANYLYGSSKAGLDAYSQGLAEAMRGTGVEVQIVRPGFVRSKMTKGRAEAPFTVDPHEVAMAVARGIETNQRVIWAPGILRWVFVVMRQLPQAIWRKLPG